MTPLKVINVKAMWCLKVHLSNTSTNIVHVLLSD